MGVEEGGEARRAGFLLALEQDRHGHRQRAMGRDDGAAGLDEGHQLSLVVGRPARHQDLAVRPVLELGLERSALPEVERVGGLHVVMAVEQDARAAIPRVFRRLRSAMGHDHGLSRRVAARGVEAKPAQVIDQPVGGAHAVVGIGGVGRDGRDAQQVEQPRHAGVEVFVDGGENGVDP